MTQLRKRGRGEKRGPRVAEVVATELRRRILDGEISDGDALPKLEDLLTEFSVSGPSLREAMRILETEGLISVRRGNQGGAIVHRPTSTAVGFMVGMVLHASRVPLVDLGQAMLMYEPACVAMCAERADRNETLVPLLKKLNDELEQNLDNIPAFTNANRGFHEVIVTQCGNATMSLVTGALETLWSAHEMKWAELADQGGFYPPDHGRREVLRTHRRLAEAIEDGDAEYARTLMTRHLIETQSYTLGPGESNDLVTINRMMDADKSTAWGA